MHSHRQTSMLAGHSLVAGRVIARAWVDASYLQKLLAHAEDTLQRYPGVGVPEGVRVKIVQNTNRLTHLVIGTTAHTDPPSEFGELRHFSEGYSDPRLEPLVWCARDAITTRRLTTNPLSLLSTWGVSAPKGMRVKVLVNGPHLVHFALPLPPANVNEKKKMIRILKACGAQISLKYAGLTAVAGVLAG